MALINYQFFMMIFFVLGIGLGLILPLIALVDIIKNEFTGNNKLIWVVVVIFFPILGSILYFALGKDQKIRQS